MPRYYITLTVDHPRSPDDAVADIMNHATAALETLPAEHLPFEMVGQVGMQEHGELFSAEERLRMAYDTILTLDRQRRYLRTVMRSIVNGVSQWPDVQAMSAVSQLAADALSHTDTLTDTLTEE